jgi:hypothetical protein
MNSSDTLFWRRVSDDLALDIATPFEAVLLDGTKLSVSAFVRNFGPPRGMLIAAEQDQLKGCEKKIIESGFGYSTNLGNAPEQYDRASMIDVLNDWGWSGPEERRPAWVNPNSNRA